MQKKRAIHEFFSHPDYTVGYGIKPYLPFGSQTRLPMGNFTPPQRIYIT